MKCLRLFLSILMVLIVMVGACGCVSNKEDKMRDAALAYLNEKYEDDFTVRSFSAGGWAYEYSSAFFSSEKYPDSSVEVRVYEAEDGTLVFKDNYYHSFMMKEAVEYFQSRVGKVKSSVKVRFLNTVWSDELNDSKTFTDWVNQGSCHLDVFIITENAMPENGRSKIVSSIAEQKIYGSVYFLTTNDDLLLNDKTLDEILNNQNDFVVTENGYYINSYFEIKSK